MAENNKHDNFDFPPVGRKNNKMQKFGGYWTYIIIAAILIGYQFCSIPKNDERKAKKKFKNQIIVK